MWSDTLQHGDSYLHPNTPPWQRYGELTCEYCNGRYWAQNHREHLEKSAACWEAFQVTLSAQFDRRWEDREHWYLNVKKWTCRECGRDVYGLGRTGGLCRDCRFARKKRQRTSSDSTGCVVCGEQLTGRRLGDKRYCGAACRQQARRDRKKAAIRHG
jgi:hypothetical protein